MLTYQYPVDDGFITISPFGPRGNGVHYGWDVVHQNLQTYAWGNTHILKVGSKEKSFGNYFDAYVEYIDDRFIWTRYAHLEREPEVVAGHMYETGYKFGPMGATGFTTGVHLHLGTKMLLNINGIEQWVWTDPWLTIKMCQQNTVYHSLKEAEEAVKQLKYQVGLQNNQLGECKTLLTERTAEVEDLKKKIKEK